MDSNTPENKAIEVKVEVVNQDSPQTLPVDTTQEPKEGDIHQKIRPKHLRPPWPKGVSGNPKGKPKGTIQIKDTIRRKLNKKEADKVADSIIQGAMAGEDKKQDRLLKLTGDLDETPQINIQNNSLTISADVLELAKIIIAERNKPKN